MAASLSLCMIVKNEADVIERCLNSVKDACDEIIVVDTGSSDETIDLAQKCGAEVFFFHWIDDFAAARNYAFSLATKQYIMWLDADDILKPDDLKQLLEVKNQVLDGTVREVVAKYDVAFDEFGNPNFTYFRERIFLRSAGFQWRGAVHETVALESSAHYAAFHVTHLKTRPSAKGRNLKIMEKQRKRGEVFSPRQVYYYGRELYYNGKTKAALSQFKKFLKTDGWVEDKIGACLLASKCCMDLNRTEGALDMLFMSFRYASPRPEVCCEIGRIFMDRNDYLSAIYWYGSALKPANGANSGGFIQTDYYGYIPLLQLCVCFDRLKEYETANVYNEQAALLKPQSSAVLHNRAYFQKLLKP